MRKPAVFRVGALASLLAFAVIVGRAQSGSSATPPVPSSQAPAAGGGSAAAAAPAAGQAQMAPPANAKPAKVWTNDEVDSLRRQSSVSIVGKSGQQTGRPSSVKPKGYSMEKDPNWYRRQLQPLQAEIDQLDAQIEKTKAFLSGERVNDAPASQGAYYGLAGNPQEQLRKLEGRRDKDVAKVNDLLDRARHNDIPPGDLR